MFGPIFIVIGVALYQPVPEYVERLHGKRPDDHSHSENETPIVYRTSNSAIGSSMTTAFIVENQFCDKNLI